MKQKTKDLLEKAADYLSDDVCLSDRVGAGKLSLEITEYLKTKIVKPEKGFREDVLSDAEAIELQRRGITNGDSSFYTKEFRPLLHKVKDVLRYG